MSDWSKMLVNGYGPSIWYIGDFALPIHIQSMKNSDIKEIIEELNRPFEKDQLPKIILNRISKKTVYIKVDNPDMLTQQMGTHGAMSYMYAVLYSLASIDKIDCVWFDFEEGDHAIPGKYCR